MQGAWNTPERSPACEGLKEREQSPHQQCAPAAPDASGEASDAGASAVPVARPCAAPYAGDGGAGAAAGPASVPTHASTLAPAEAYSCAYSDKRMTSTWVRHAAPYNLCPAAVYAGRSSIDLGNQGGPVHAQHAIGK